MSNMKIPRISDPSIFENAVMTDHGRVEDSNFYKSVFKISGKELVSFYFYDKNDKPSNRSKDIVTERYNWDAGFLSAHDLDLKKAVFGEDLKNAVGC